jgi:hypothetical protein
LMIVFYFLDSLSLTEYLFLENSASISKHPQERERKTGNRESSDPRS